jgi:hypothetical protein
MQHHYTPSSTASVYHQAARVRYVVAKLLLCAVATVATVAATAHAQTDVRVQGTYRFGPDVAQARACELATQEAKRVAVQTVGGEDIRATRLMVCAESSLAQQQPGGSACSLSRYLWSELSGVLVSSSVLRTEVTPYVGGSACTVTLQASVALPQGEPDPSFDFAMTLDRPIYRVGEAIRLDMSPTQAGYLTVFNWAPVSGEQAALSRVLPFADAPSVHITTQQTLPADADGVRLEVGAYPIDPANAAWRAPPTWAEYLIAVYTKYPVRWAQTLSLSEFGRKLQELPRSDVRWQSHIFQVIQQPQPKKEALQ